MTASDGRDIMLVTADATTSKLMFAGGDASGSATLAALDARKTGDLTLSANRTLSGDISVGGTATTADTGKTNVQAVGSIQNADISTVSGANTTIKAIDSALSQVDSYRAGLGAVQNRFESTIRNLSAVSESLSAANSRIKDADFAAESANLSKNQVLQQAGNSILAQANALPQQALSLLG